MALISPIYIQRLLLSFSEDAICAMLQALTVSLGKWAGGENPRLEYMRYGRDASNDELWGRVIDELTALILNPEDRRVRFTFRCRLRRNCKTEVWSFDVLKTSIPNISGGIGPCPQNSINIDREAMFEWVTEGAIDIARSVSAFDASYSAYDASVEGWVVARPLYLYVIEKTYNNSKLNKCFYSKRNKIQSSLIQSLVTELDQVNKSEKWYPDCVHLTTVKNGLNVFIRKLDERLLEHWGESKFSAHITDLGVSLRQWLR